MSCISSIKHMSLEPDVQLYSSLFVFATRDANVAIDS